jgi:hypothetical protein
MPSMLTGLLRFDTAVMIGRAITTKFSANGTGGALQNPRYGSNAVILLLQTAERDSIFRLKLLIVF